MFSGVCNLHLGSLLFTCVMLVKCGLSDVAAWVLGLFIEDEKHLTAYFFLLNAACCVSVAKLCSIFLIKGCIGSISP